MDRGDLIPFNAIIVTDVLLMHTVYEMRPYAVPILLLLLNLFTQKLVYSDLCNFNNIL